MSEWTERPKTGEIWHFGTSCGNLPCTPLLVAVNQDLWLEYFRGSDDPTAVEPWDSMMMHWPDDDQDH